MSVCWVILVFIVFHKALVCDYYRGPSELYITVVNFKFLLLASMHCCFNDLLCLTSPSLSLALVHFHSAPLQITHQIKTFTSETFRLTAS